jgi:hypothetical protein
MGKELKVKITGDVEEFASAARKAVSTMNEVRQASRQQQQDEQEVARLRAQLNTLQRRAREEAFKQLPVEEQLNKLIEKRAELQRRMDQPGVARSSKVQLAYDIVGANLDRQIAEARKLVDSDQMAKAAAARKDADTSEQARMSGLAGAAKESASAILAKDAEAAAAARAKQEQFEARLATKSRELFQIAQAQRQEAFKQLEPKKQLEVLEQKRVQLMRFLERAGENELRRTSLLIALRRTEASIGAMRPPAGPTLGQQARNLITSTFGQFTMSSMLQRAGMWMSGQVRELLNDAQRIRAGAARLGVSSETFQEYEAGSKKTEIDSSIVAGGFKEMRLSQARALKGNKGDIAAFAALGVTLDDLQRKGPEELFRQIGDRVNSTGESVQELDAAVQILGRSADQILPAFRNGFFEAGDAARKAGAIINDQYLEELEAFKEGLGSTGAILAASFAPALAWIAGQFEGLLNGVVTEMQGIGAFWGTLAGGGTWTQAGNAFGKVLDANAAARAKLDSERKNKPGGDLDDSKEVAALQKQIREKEEALAFSRLTTEQKITALKERQQQLLRDSGNMALTEKERLEARLKELEIREKLAGLDGREGGRGITTDSLARVGGFVGGRPNSNHRAEEIARNQLAVAREQLNLANRILGSLNRTFGS